MAEPIHDNQHSAELSAAVNTGTGSTQGTSIELASKEPAKITLDEDLKALNVPPKQEEPKHDAPKQEASHPVEIKPGDKPVLFKQRSWRVKNHEVVAQAPSSTVGLHVDLALLNGLPGSLPAKRKIKTIDPLCTTRYVFTFPIYAVFFVLAACTITLPFLVLLYTLWMISVSIKFIRWASCCPTPATEMIRTNNGVYKITTVTHKEQALFQFFRSPGYIWNLSWGFAYAIARYFSCHAYTRVIPDDVLARFTVGSLFSHALVENEGGFYMDTRYLQTMQIFEGTCMEVTNVQLAPDGSVTQLTMVDGSTHKPGDPTWDLAKLHLQGCFSTLTTCFEHSWVHFVFPDAGAVALHHVSQDSLIYKLLYPHLRYTAAINRIRTKGGSSLPITNLECCCMDFMHWLHLPYTFDTFMAANSDHCNRFYFPDDVEARIFPGNSRQHLSNFRLPPYDQDYKPVTPYHTFLFSYFLVIKGFVRRFKADIEADRTEYNKWVNKVAEHLPDVLQADPVDVIATLIWQVSVVHCADHVSLNQYRPYLCGYNRRKWNPEDKNKLNGFFSAYDLVRTQSFLDTFDMPWYNPFQRLLLMNIDHGFSDPLHQCWDAEFRLALRENQHLLNREDLNLVPLDQIIDSLCF